MEIASEIREPAAIAQATIVGWLSHMGDTL
jgi:hypothetical protein